MNAVARRPPFLEIIKKRKTLFQSIKKINYTFLLHTTFFLNQGKRERNEVFFSKFFKLSN